MLLSWELWWFYKRSHRDVIKVQTEELGKREPGTKEKKSLESKEMGGIFKEEEERWSEEIASYARR